MTNIDSNIDPTPHIKPVKTLPDVLADLGSVPTTHDDSARTSSTLRSAEKEGLDQQKEMAGAPVLPPPLPLNNEYDFSMASLLRTLQVGEKGNMTSAEALLLVNQTMMQATTTVLDAWVKNIKDIQEYKELTSAIERRKDDVLAAIKHSEGVQDKNAQDTIDSVQKFAAFGLLLSAGMLSLGMGHVIAPTGLVALNALKEIGGIISVVMPIALDGAIASLISLFGAGIVTQAAVLTLKSADQNEEKYTRNFAENYAARSLQVVAGGDFKTAILTIAGPGDTGMISTKSSIANIAILSQSLAFAYHLETGSLTGQEFAGLLNGTIQLPEDDFRNPLIAAIRVQLSSLLPEHSSAVVEKLMAYFDTKPNLDELSEPAQAIRSMFAPAVRLPIQG